MKYKTRIQSIIILSFIILLINFISAEMLVSEAGVIYNDEILEKFKTQNFVDVIIRLENSLYAQNLISTFSEEDVRNIIHRDISPDKIAAEVNEKTFFELIGNNKIKRIDYNRPIHGSSGNETNRLQESLLIIFVIFFVVLLISVSIKKRGKYGKSR